MPSTPKTFVDPFDSSDLPETPVTTEIVSSSELRARQQFLFSAISDELYSNHAALGSILERRLNAKLNLRNYSEAIHQIHIVPILLAEDSSIHKAVSFFEPETSRLLLSPCVPLRDLESTKLEDYPSILATALYEQGSSIAEVPEELLSQMQEVLSQPITDSERQRQFLVSYVVHRDFAAFAYLSDELEQALNEKIELSDFDDRIQRVIISPVLLSKDLLLSDIQPEFDTNSGEIFLCPRIPTVDLTETSVAEFKLKLAEAIYLQGITIPGIPEKLLDRIRKVLSNNY